MTTKLYPPVATQYRPTNEEFQVLCKPLIQWLNDQGHPHMHITITPTSAEWSEGVQAFTTEEFLHD